MEADSSQLDKLPFLEDALLLPKSEFDKIAKAFVNYSAYCDYIFLPDKVDEWCKKLECKSGACTYQFNDSFVTQNTLITTQAVTSISKNCYDMFFCPPTWSAEIDYYSLGITCLIILIIALIMNLIYLPSFTFYGQRNGTDILLTSLAISDVVIILFSLYIDCIPYLQKTREQQQYYYSKYVALFIPYFLPLQCFFQTLSSWILCLLLFERYLYQQHGKHAKLIFPFQTAIVSLTCFVVILFGFTILKFFEMTSISIPEAFYSVKLTKTGSNDSFHNLITNWLKVPLEYFGPLLGFVSLLSMMYTSLGEQGTLLNKPPSQHSANYKNLIKNLVIINESEREDRILISVLLMSTVAIVVKLPKFIYHILITEEANISIDRLHYIMISYIILDALFIFMKPFVYIYISPNYCCNMHRYCLASCPGNQDGAVGVSMTFEQTIANRMRESISYRSSIWAPNPHDPDVIYKC